MFRLGIFQSNEDVYWQRRVAEIRPYAWHLRSLRSEWSSAITGPRVLPSQLKNRSNYNCLYEKQRLLTEDLFLPGSQLDSGACDRNSWTIYQSIVLTGFDNDSFLKMLSIINHEKLKNLLGQSPMEHGYVSVLLGNGWNWSLFFVRGRTIDSGGGGGAAGDFLKKIFLGNKSLKKKL